jgi:hypothetical protein
MSADANLFDGRLTMIFWSPRSVFETRIAELADNIRTAAPNVNGLCFKTNNGTVWQSAYDATKPDLTVGSVADVGRWSQTLRAHGLEPYAWCVLRGQAPDQEADRIAAICLQGGIKAMLLDLESGSNFFVGNRAAAQALAVGLRSRLGANFHLGLAFDARGAHPQLLWVQDVWFPEVDSLHPMVYPYNFGVTAAQAFQDCYAALGSWGKPIYPMLEGYTPAGYPPYPASDIPATAALVVNKYHASGFSIFRYGLGLDAGDGVNRTDLSEVAKIALYDAGPVTIVGPAPLPPVAGDATPPANTPAATVTVDPSHERTGEFTIGYYGDPFALSARWAVALDVNGCPYAYRPASYNDQTLYATYQPRLAAPGTYAVEVFVPRLHAYVQDAHYVIVDHPGGVRREVTAILNQATAFDAWAPLQGTSPNGTAGGAVVSQFQLDPSQPDSGRVVLADVTFVDPASQPSEKFEIAFGAIRWRPPQNGSG